MIDIFFPSMKIVITENDKKWITSEIKHLIAERQKAYMSGNFDLAKHLAKKIKQEIKKAKINYNTHKAEMFTCSSTKEWYQHITTIINKCKWNNLLLQNIPDLAQKSMEEIVLTVNNHFAAICQTYPTYNDTETYVDPDGPNLELITEHHT